MSTDFAFAENWRYLQFMHSFGIWQIYNGILSFLFSIFVLLMGKRLNKCYIIPLRNVVSETNYHDSLVLEALWEP